MQNAQKPNHHNSVIGILQILFGTILITIFGLILLGSFALPSPPGMIIFSLIFTLLSALMLIRGLKNTGVIKSKKLPLPAPPVQNLNSFNDNMGVSLPEFQNIQINEESLNNGSKTFKTITFNTNAPTFHAPPKAAPRYIVVTCKSCGAKNKVLEGSVSECEYCKTLLQKQ